MSDDRISSIVGGSQDRSSLNVSGRAGSKMWMLLAGLGAMIVAVPLAIHFTTSHAKAEQVAQKDSATAANFEAGKLDNQSSDTSQAITSIKKQQQEIERQRREEEAKRLEEQKTAMAKQVAELQAQLKAKQAKAATSQPKPMPNLAPRHHPAPAGYYGNNRDAMTPEMRKQTGSVTVELKNQPRVPANSPKYSDAFTAQRFANGSASLRKQGALDFLLIHGTNIPCALYTQIISDYEGYVTCRVTQDVYSANGATLLVEKGSMVNGEQKVALEQGKARIFTKWADIETPNAISIQIDSLGAGALGASGSKAWVDNHFSERFGGAIMLSFVDDALATASKRASDSNVEFDNSTKNASDMASKALDSSINIKPTGYSYIGQRINILVARDIDMSSVYHLEEDIPQ